MRVGALGSKHWNAMPSCDQQQNASRQVRLCATSITSTQNLCPIEFSTTAPEQFRCGKLFAQAATVREAARGVIVGSVAG